MTLEPTHAAAVWSRLAIGAVAGVLAGILVDVLGVLGLAVLVLVIAIAADVPPRFALLAGVLIAAGGLWLFFSLQAVVFCTQNPAHCSGPSPIPFAAVSGIVLAAGLVALAVTRRRFGQSRDIHQH